MIAPCSGFIKLIIYRFISLFEIHNESSLVYSSGPSHDIEIDFSKDQYTFFIPSTNNLVI